MIEVESIHFLSAVASWLSFLLPPSVFGAGAGAAGGGGGGGGERERGV